MFSQIRDVERFRSSESHSPLSVRSFVASRSFASNSFRNRRLRSTQPSSVFRTLTFVIITARPPLNHHVSSVASFVETRLLDRECWRRAIHYTVQWENSSLHVCVELKRPARRDGAHQLVALVVDGAAEVLTDHEGNGKVDAAI